MDINDLKDAAQQAFDFILEVGATAPGIPDVGGVKTTDEAIDEEGYVAGEFPMLPDILRIHD